MESEISTSRSSAARLPILNIKGESNISKYEIPELVWYLGLSVLVKYSPDLLFFMVQLSLEFDHSLSWKN